MIDASSQPVPFEQRRFRTAAEHYLAGRPPYAAGLIARVAQLCRLAPADRVMDLGCGPGQLARASAPLVAEVVALDPEPEMLRVAQAASMGFANIAWHRAGSDELSTQFGTFRLVCMGRSFHWMDRAETLRRLDRIVEPDGAVALFHDTHPDLPDNAWYGGYREILERYSSDDNARWGRHEGFLLDSAFSRIEEIGVYERRETSIDVLVERALSMSSTSRAQLGDRADEMIAQLRASLPPGGLREVVASQAMLAWRP